MKAAVIKSQQHTTKKSYVHTEKQQTQNEKNLRKSNCQIQGQTLQR